ncbi:hypothetical protein GCM10023185_21980 [Hymenobacter saemangeumensis]|uniref:FtsX-like permease family protein n=1 Tax=Hymenobacter saemangeumensis TaxID=1084522 RepID=A0ABP8IEV7_9BACT
METPENRPSLVWALVKSVGLACLCTATAWLLWDLARQDGLAFIYGLGDSQISVEGARAREFTKLITLGILIAGLVFFMGAYAGFRQAYLQGLARSTSQQMRLAQIWWCMLRVQRVAWIAVTCLIVLACLLSVGTSRGQRWD